MKFNYAKIYFIIAIIFCQHSLGQGAVDGFYKGKSALEIGVGGGVEIHDKYFAGSKKVGISRTIFNVNLFGSYGITKNLDVYFGLPYVAINDVKSIQDGSIYIKNRFFQIPFYFGALTANIAVGYRGNLADYETEGLSAIGQQAKTLDFRPILHLKMDSNWFFTLQGGYLYKFDPVPSSVNGVFKAGKATANYYFDFWYDFQNTDGGLDYQGTPTPDTFRKLGVNYHKVGGTFYKPLGNKFGFYVGASTVITGRNIGQGTGLNIGFIIKG